MYSIVTEESCNFIWSSERVALESCSYIKMYIQYIFPKNSFYATPFPAESKKKNFYHNLKGRNWMKFCPTSSPLSPLSLFRNFNE